MNTTPIRPFERVDYAIYAVLAGFKMWIHIATAGRYGMFRDEYYYLACASRLDWGYVDQPPLSIALLALTRSIFGDSLFATRLPGIIVSGLVVLLVGLLARRLGGGRFAQGFAMLAIVACPMFLGIHSYYSMNVLDHFFWALAAYVFVLIIQTDNARLWLLFGLICGLGLQNKTSVAFLGWGLVVAMAFTSQRKWFASPWLYAGGALALLVYLPNILWQFANDFAMLEFMRNAALHKNAPMGPLEYTLEIIKVFHPFLLPVWLLGAAYPFLRSEAAAYRPLAIIFAVVLVTFALTNGKAYYAAPAFLIAFPLGSVWLERLTEGTKVWRPAIAYVLIFGGLLMAPIAIPMLPPKMALDYMQAIGIVPKPAELGHVGDMPQHFADRFGWQKRAELVKKACDSLSAEERAKAVIVSTNYGEAAAMEYYADELQLPPSITGHNNFWLWGPGEATGEVAILICRPDDEMLQAFESVEDFGALDEPYQLEGWRQARVYVARKLNRPLAETWANFKHYI